ncbi:MAG: hypothetical protein JXR83_17380 [Deltaproteobacteria bacterium]|nr:hypothetical protein [Deltaproteobacteria bacterium]
MVDPRSNRYNVFFGSDRTGVMGVGRLFRSMRLWIALLLVAAWPSPALTAPARKPGPVVPAPPPAGGDGRIHIDDPAAYILQYASSPPPADRLERQRLRPRPRQPSPLWASGVVGDIVVMEGDDGYAYVGSDGHIYFDDNTIFDVANRVLAYTDDSHDEIVIWSTFAQTGADYAAYYLPLSNDVAGLGDCNERNGENQGCRYDNAPGVRVQGLIYMSSIESWREMEYNIYYRSRPLDDLDAMVYGGIGHETIHRWLAALRFVHPGTGQVSKQMLGESLAHWHPCVDGDGSMLYGWDWDEQSPGTFELLAESVRYSDLDLYAMGVLPPDSVRDWFIIENGNSTELARLMSDFGYSFNGNISAGPGLFVPIPPVDYIDEVLGRYYPAFAPHITATGDRLDLFIDDVIAAEGPRLPEYGRAPTTLRQVWALVTAPGQRLSQVAGFVSAVDSVRQYYERWFAQKTRGLMHVCTKLSGDCPVPALEAQNARFEDSPTGNDGVADPGELVGYRPIAYNAGTETAHAVLVRARAIDPGIAIDNPETAIGDIEPETAYDADPPLAVRVAENTSCGAPQRFEIVFKGQDTAEWRQVQVVYTGLRRSDGTDFEAGDDGWLANAAGGDDAWAGQFASGISSATYAGKTRVTPAGQTTAGGCWAMLTDPGLGAAAGDTDVDGGGTSLQSRSYSIAGLKDPHVGYRFWHVAVDGQGNPWEDNDNRLQVEISGDRGKTFRPLAQHLTNTRDWEVAVVRLRDLFKEELPQQIALRFTQFDGGEDDVVEAGVDDVAIYDLAGKCTPSGCGCAAARAATPAPLLAVLALLWWRLRRGRSGCC